MALTDRDHSRLKSQLMQAGLQQTNNALFQVINQLIEMLTNANSNTSSSGVTTLFSSRAPASASFLTVNNESSTLPSSRQLLAGTNIIFDDTIINQRTISSSGGLSQAQALKLVSYRG